MAIHPPECECTGSYGCRKRRQGFSLSSDATPTRIGRRPYRDPAKHNHNSWEAGIAGEHRPGGTFMPYLRADGTRMGVKEFADNRHHLEKVRDDLRKAPAPLN